MFRVLLERAAEKDLSRLSSEIHDRLIAAIQALAIGASAWATTASFTKSPRRFGLCASTASATGAKSIGDPKLKMTGGCPDPLNRRSGVYRLRYSHTTPCASETCFAFGVPRRLAKPFTRRILREEV
jgi:hypothetical protein